VRHVSLAQREEGLEVAVHQRGLLDHGHQRTVDRLLRCDALRLQLRLLIGVAEELLTVLLRLGLLRPREEGIVNLGDVRTLHVNRRGGGDAVRLVHSPQRHTVQLVRASHEQQARGQLLEEDHTLATEAAAKHDQHRASLDGLLELRDTPRVSLAITRRLRLDVVGRVPLGCLDRRHFPVLAVLGATDSLLHHLAAVLY